MRRSEPAIPPHKRNGYGLLRLVLASTVIVQHSLALTGNEDYVWLGWWRPTSYGDLAVAGFFGLSGYLLHTSVTRHPPARFLRLRFFRLFPGFWVTLVAVAFAFAPLIALASGDIGAYRLVGPDSAVTYVGFNAGLVIVQHSIGEVAASNPYPLALDGALWSLAPEFLCYLTLLLVVVAGRRLGVTGPLVPAVTAAAAWLVFALAGPVLSPVVGDGRAAALTLLASLATTFFAGAWLAATKRLDGCSAATAAGWAGVLVVVVAAGLWNPLGPLALAATVVAVGAALRTGWPSRVGTRADLSYGVYLYHFPVIQLLVAAGLTGLTVLWAVVWLVPVTLLLTLPVAAASWFGVEAPAQRRGRRKRQPVAVVRPSPS